MGNKNPQPTPNDQRSDGKNPNNPAHKEAGDNRSRQLNPQDPRHQTPREPSPPPPAKKP